NYIEFASVSNYHSMQTQVNRRFTRNLTFGLSWTWSKVLDLVDDNNTAVNPFINPRVRNYGKAGIDRTHNFVLSYTYQVPRLSGRWNNGFARGLLDHWEISGITSFVSGAPLGIGYSFSTARDVTGGAGAGVDSRVILTGDPNLPKGERTQTRYFRTEVVRPPNRSDFGVGNASKDPLRGPGINNWDISIFKNFPVGSDGARRFQFRWEM